MKFTAKQKQVIALAQKILKEQHNLTALSLDQLPKDADIDRDGIEECAAAMVIDTAYWEGYIP